MEAFQPGCCLGAYRILRSLGEGGMGCVYEAEHVELKVRRALKVFSTGSEYSEILRKKFVQEGRMLADLQHPRIVRVYDFALDEETGTPYFAMDLVVSPSGVPQTLEDACSDGFDEERVAGWFHDICEGLAYIHSKGVVHRDIALDNILIDGDGRAVLTDFGIARITGEAYRRKIDVTVTMPLPTGEKLCMGKGLYMAPEVQDGADATPASDAYAVGVLLFRLLAGSWYTPDTRLEGALAGFDRYDWVPCLSSLLSADPAQRIPNGIAGCVLSPCGKGRCLAKRGWLIGWSAAAAVVLAALGFILASRQSSAKVRFGERPRGEKSVEVTPAQMDVLKNAILANGRSSSEHKKEK